eukprot:19123-Eustigmatos_ZCMA.PRE.1
MPGRTIRERKDEAFSQIQRLLQQSPLDEERLNNIVQSRNLTHEDVAGRLLVHWSIVEVGTSKLRAALRWLQDNGTDLYEMDYRQRLRPLE